MRARRYEILLSQTRATQDLEIDHRLLYQASQPTSFVSTFCVNFGAACYLFENFVSQNVFMRFACVVRDPVVVFGSPENKFSVES